LNPNQLFFHIAAQKTAKPEQNGVKNVYQSAPALPKESLTLQP
jgi:hypothetical protein